MPLEVRARFDLHRFRICISGRLESVISGFLAIFWCISCFSWLDSSFIPLGHSTLGRTEIMSTESVPEGRARAIVSMDQFRGYTVAGMFLVNFVGGLAAFPEVLKHHNGHPYFSYADTIMPSFMFAAGFSYRLTTLRRLAQQGPGRTYGHW